MSLEDIKKTTQTKMDQSIAAFKNNLTKIRTGRANPAILDTIQVDYYGSMMPLSQVANVSLIDSRTISVQPWEKNMAAKIEKAIRENDVVIVSGGISVGDYDFVGKALESLNVETLFYKVNQKPGKPLFFGRKGNKFVFAFVIKVSTPNDSLSKSVLTSI